MTFANHIHEERDAVNRKKKPTQKLLRDGNVDKPISKAHKVYDTDLARDNLENDIPAADFQDL